MVKRDKNKITIEENLKNLNIFFEDYFANIYNYYAKGVGYNLSKYHKKTKYRFCDNLKISKNILEKEDLEKIKKEFLLFHLELEKKKKKESLRNTDWVQAEIVINSCFLQITYIEEILKQIVEKKIDTEKIEKEVFSQLEDARWEYEKLLGKNFSHREYYSCLEKAITKIKRKKK